MLLIKLENHLILFHFFLLEAQSITFSYIKNYGHRHKQYTLLALGDSGLENWWYRHIFWNNRHSYPCF